ncbi:hypothetical protein [Phocaeicola sartorii]|uniref:hypothetical protein n=1 Tax=Phocaeicola sartorii TaxID=671267 RepID=UPI00272A547C|nr:hypothetical protein [Phocaeicola sartorii]
MASVKFEKGSREWYMFQDYWKLCQKFWIPEDNDEYWESVVSETNDFYEKYKDVMLTKWITLELINCLEKKSKKLVQEKEGR